jgi:cytochrome c oxidase cbb3-type subunit 3
VKVAAAVLASAGALALAGCWRERRELQQPPAATPPPRPVSITEQQQRALTGGHRYENNAWGISEGGRLYEWFNCTGCHGYGGGGSGPALMDDHWLYGSDPASIYTSISEGRPNGMPSFGSQLRPEQVWQLTAYVRSLARLQRFDTYAPRADGMATRSLKRQSR